MKEGEKIHSIEFTSAGCVLNGEPPIFVQMPAEVAPPGSLDTAESRKPAAPKEPTEAEKIEQDALALARIINHRRAESKKYIKEV
jgi:hypothetical protein